MKLKQKIELLTAIINLASAIIMLATLINK